MHSIQNFYFPANYLLSLATKRENLLFFLARRGSELKIQSTCGGWSLRNKAKLWKTKREKAVEFCSVEYISPKKSIYI